MPDNGLNPQWSQVNFACAVWSPEQTLLKVSVYNSKSSPDPNLNPHPSPDPDQVPTLQRLPHVSAVQGAVLILTLTLTLTLTLALALTLTIILTLALP